MKGKKVWIRIAHCHQIRLREGRAVKIGKCEIAIFNLGSRFLAVDNRCPHAGGPLADGIVSGAAVVCPLHARKFSLETGQGLDSASASTCLKSFPTRVEHGIVFVDLGHDCGDDQDRRPDMALICAPADVPAARGDLPLRT